MRLASGTRLGPYEILAPLGAGGMGEVYRARDTRLRREVALKVVPASLAEDPEALARFQTEAETVAALSHPNLVAIFDVGHQDDVSYLVMELLEGQTLRETLRQGPVSAATALDYARQTARGLAAAHGKGVVHRDLKPENLFVTRDGLLKILDFGLARQADTKTLDPASTPTLTRHTTPGTVMGSTGYMSPEQVRGRETDARSDVFSFGAILYEMVTGRRAFAGESSADTLSAILKEEPPDLPEGALRRLIARCLAKEAGQRFSSGADLQFALEALEASGSGAARAVPAPETASIAVLPFANISPDPDTEYFSDGVTEEIISTLTQLPGVLVAARTSSFAFKDKPQDLRSIADRLNVAYVLEGSVRRAGNKLRITARLVRADDGHQLWSQRYDRELADVFAIQDEIAQSIAEKLKLTLANDRGGEAAARDHEAYDLYLKGRYFFNRRAAPQAIGQFEEAIARDPGFAAAYTGLADSYGIHAFYGGIDTRVAHAKARAAVERARALAPDSADVLLSVAILEHYFGWDFANEERQLQIALERPQHGSAVLYWLSLCHGLRGRLAQALPLVEEAARLEPLSPYPDSAAGYVYLTAQRFEDGRAAFLRGLEIEPNAILLLSGLAQCEQALGNHEASVAAAEKIPLVSGQRSSFGLGAMALAYARAGAAEPARRILAELEERAPREYVAPIHVGPALLHLGERERAFRAYARACDERNALAWWWLLHDPASEALRGDPRFPALAERVRPAA